MKKKEKLDVLDRLMKELTKKIDKDYGTDYEKLSQLLDEDSKFLVEKKDGKTTVQVSGVGESIVYAIWSAMIENEHVATLVKEAVKRFKRIK